MKKISEKVHAFAEKQYNCYNRSIIPSLRANGINFVKADEMTDEQKAFADDYFQRVVFPVLTPMAVDTSRPFHCLQTKVLTLQFCLQMQREKNFMRLYKCRQFFPRFLELTSKRQA